jgi:hypothetical protein
MICKILSRIERFLREHQDPRYRDAPWILPRVWHGSGRGHLTTEELARFNVKDIGLDPKIVANQRVHRMLNLLRKDSVIGQSKTPGQP